MSYFGGAPIYPHYFAFDNTQALCVYAPIPSNAKTIIITNGPSIVDGGAIHSYDSLMITVRGSTAAAAASVPVADAQNNCYPLNLGSTLVLPVGFATDRPANPSFVLLARYVASPRTGTMCASVTFILHNAEMQGA